MHCLCNCVINLRSVIFVIAYCQQKINCLFPPEIIFSDVNRDENIIFLPGKVFELWPNNDLSKMWIGNDFPWLSCSTEKFTIRGIAEVFRVI